MALPLHWPRMDSVHPLPSFVSLDAKIRPTFVNHPLVVLSIVALCGSVSSVALGPAVAVSAGWMLFAGQRLLAHKHQRPTPVQRGFRLALVALLFVICHLRAERELSAFQERYFKTAAALPGPSRCAGQATVIQSPTLRTQDQEGDGGQTVTLWTGQVESLDCEGTMIQGPIRVRLYGGTPDLARGDEVEIIAGLAPVRLFRNASLPSPWPGAARRQAVLSGSALDAQVVRKGQSIFAHIDRLRAHVRQRIMNTYSPQSAPLGKALVLGENDLNESDAEAFRDSGLLHLLAVSGTHLVIAVFALVEGLRALLVRIGPLARRYDVARVSSAFGALMSLLYADFSGGSGSAWRAAFMLCLVCGGRTLGLRINGAAALGSSLLVGIAIDPLAGSDYSFLLSALATAGLIGIGQPLAKICTHGRLSSGPLRALTLSIIATISSTLPCAPVLAMMDGDMTFAALFANVIAGPLGELIALPACLLHGATSFSPPLESGLALLGSGALYGVRQVALWSASVDSAQFAVPFPSNWGLTTSLILLLAIHHQMDWIKPGIERLKKTLYSSSRRHPKKHRKAWLAVGATMSALFCAIPLTSLASGPHPEAADPIRPNQQTLTITALDVGQGDALVIDFPDGKIGLLDGGGFATGVPDTGKRVLWPYFRSRGIRELDVVIVSHPHPDHINGLLSLSTQMSFKELWIPSAGLSKKGSMAELISRAEQSGARIVESKALCDQTRNPTTGGSAPPTTRRQGFAFGAARVEVFAPCEASEPQLGANDDSMVVRISHHKRSVLFTGDIEEKGEARLLKGDRSLLRADLLKVAHHGSHTSSQPAFIDAVQPSVAFISSGVRNRFRHPRPITLKNLTQTTHGNRRDILVLRTDQQGSLSWSTNGKDIQVRTFDKKYSLRH